jgi:benzoate 4-monooxygenase
MVSNLQDLIKQWNRISETATKAGQEYAEIDSLHWFNYLAFDIIGDLVSTTTNMERIQLA